MLTVIILVFSVPSTVSATLEDDLTEIQEKLEEIRNQRKNIESNIDNEKAAANKYEAELFQLKDKIDLLETQIEEKALTIEELQVEIEILENEIDETATTIVNTENDITELQDETDRRLIDMYLSQKTFSQFDLILTTQGTDIVKINLYQSSIQQETNSMLEDLARMKENLAIQKTKLEDGKIQVERDESQIEEEKIALEKDKATVDSQRAIYYRKKEESLSLISSLEAQAKLLTEQEFLALKEQEKIESLLNPGNLPINGYAKKGDVIGYQGMTGWYVTGPHVHFRVLVNGSHTNPCSKLASKYFPSNGVSCGSGSMGWPLSGSFYFTSSYGNRCTQWGCSFHSAIDIAHSSANAPVYAAHGGYLKKTVISGANVAMVCQHVNCNQGLRTEYWHLSSFTY